MRWVDIRGVHLLWQWAILVGNEGREGSSCEVCLHHGVSDSYISVLVPWDGSFHIDDVILVVNTANLGREEGTGVWVKGQ